MSCTLWLDREAAEEHDQSFWPAHAADCAPCRRERELDALLAEQTIAVEPGFSSAVMRSILARRRGWGLGAVAASLALMVLAGWGLGSTATSGLGSTVLTLFADVLTVGLGWLGASWAGVRLALKASLDPAALAGLALLVIGVGGLTWGLLRRRAAAARQRSDS